MHFPIPASAQDLGNAACIVAIGLVAQARQRRLHLPRFHDDHAEPFRPQTCRQPWSEVASFQRYAINMLGKASHRCGYLIDLGGNITFQAHLASLVDDTQRRRPEANVHTYIVSHHNLPVSVMATNHNYIRELASDSQQARSRMLPGGDKGALKGRHRRVADWPRAPRC